MSAAPVSIDLYRTAETDLKEKVHWWVYASPQIRELWQILLPKIRERNLAANVDTDQHIQHLRDLATVLTNFHSATANASHGGIEAHFLKEQGTLWDHRSDQYVTGLWRDKWNTIDRQKLTKAVTCYLKCEWLQVEELDWMFLDALIYAETSAFREALLSGSYIGKIDIPWVSFGESPGKYMLAEAGLSILGFSLRYVVPPIMLVYWYAHADPGSTILVAAGIAYAIYLLLRIVALPSRLSDRRKLRKGFQLLEKIALAYKYCAPPLVNFDVLEKRLADAATDGAIFEAAVYSIIQNAKRRFGSTLIVSDR